MSNPGDCEANAVKHIANLKQNKSAAAYYLRFMEAATKTLWNKSALIYYFKAGLKERILNVLAMRKDKSKTLSALAKLCIKLDQRLFDQGKRDGNRTGLSAQSWSSRSNMLTVETVLTPSFQLFQNTAPKALCGTIVLSGPACCPRGPLTPAEQDERMRLGLCLVCGDKSIFGTTVPRGVIKVLLP